MKYLIFLISAILLFSTSESSSDNYHWPFNDCYRAEFDSCSQDCTDTLTFTKTIMYAGCDVKVSYKVRQCNCPEPTAFVMITYIEIPISEPEPCCDLICELFPPGPFVQNCTGAHQLNCINNSPDAVAILALNDTLYNQLSDTIFNQVSDNYICPNKLTVKYFWPSECVGFCIYEMEEVVPSNPFGPLFAQIIAPMYCGGYACCGTIFTYCKDAQGNISKTESYQQGPIACDPPVLPACPNLDDPFDLNGTLYTIIRVRGTECRPPCYESGGGN